MCKRQLAPALTAGAVLLSALAARADTSTAQDDQLALPAHKFVVNGFLETNLSKDAAFKPVSISPDLWYGITDEATIGLVHSDVGSTGFLGGVGDSLCVTGKSNHCRSVYPNVGIDLRYRLMAPLVLDAGIFARNTDPFQMAIKIGLGARWRFGRLALEAQPNLFFGLNKRSEGMGNKDWLSIPITVSYEVVDKLDVSLQTGVQLQFEDAGDNYRVPLALAARYQFTREFNLGLAFALPQLIAPSNTPLRHLDARTLMIGGSYAF